MTIRSLIQQALRAFFKGRCAALLRPTRPSKEECHERVDQCQVCDVANLVLGASCFISPWLFAFDAGSPTQNAMISAS